MAEPRPYAIWDEKKRRALPHRRFVHKDRAHDAAILTTWHSPVGNSYTVVNVTRGWRVLQGYTRGLNGVHRALPRESE